eukprot:jgi/Galph1/4892/GphlegSOOS_G3531.1
MSIQVIQDLESFYAIRSKLQGLIGLVPTMGFLHEGHKALIRRARSECDIVIVTIFVNPTQFAPNEDFGSYPRNLESDVAICEALEVDYILTPKHSSVIYGEGFCTFVECKIGLPETNPRSEGAFRPHFFKGVATVVAKLFNITPESVFGQKDAQQCAVIRRMVIDLNFNIDIVVLPTVREEDGVAMSSRNAYLTEEERKKASILIRMLQLGKQLYLKGPHCLFPGLTYTDKRTIGVLDVTSITTAMETLANTVEGFHLHYISICDPDTFTEYNETILSRGALICVAGTLGKARLIDNILLDE